MSVFLVLFQKIIPLYFLILLGYWAGRVLRVEREGVGRLLLYIIGPVVVFSSLVETKLTLSRLSLPVLFYVLCSCMGATVYFLTQKFLKPAQRGILAFACGSGNTGYFGLPLTMFLLGEEYVGLAVLCALGFIFYEGTLGFFFAARGHHSVKESLWKVLKLPTMYAAAAGILMNLMGLRLFGSLAELATGFRGAYSVLGMMLIGLGIAGLKSWRSDPKFLTVAFVVRFLAWPLLVAFFLRLDGGTFYDLASRRVIPLMSIVPLPAISIAVASELRLDSAAMALAVLLTTAFALFYIPLVWPLVS